MINEAGKVTKIDMSDNTAHVDWGSKSGYVPIAALSFEAMASSEVMAAENSIDLHSLLRHLVLHVGGFKMADAEERGKFLLRLQNTNPCGQTALYDALFLGVIHMLRLYSKVSQMQGDQEYKFLHILLTDGSDNASKKTFSDTQGFCRELSQFEDKCTTFLIGVGLEGQAKQKLKGLADVGGENVTMLECTDNSITDIIDRIEVSMGIQQRLQILSNGESALAVQQQGLRLEISRRKFAIWFNLDTSGSMSGRKWNDTKLAMGTLLAKMTSEDVFGCAVFNDTAEVITQ